MYDLLRHLNTVLTCNDDYRSKEFVDSIPLPPSIPFHTAVHIIFEVSSVEATSALLNFLTLLYLLDASANKLPSHLQEQERF